MAVANRSASGQGSSNNNASTASATITWLCPATQGEIVAGDVWILSAGFRAGSGVTISGVPGSFTLIGRVDQGSGATVSTSVAYWYVALGSETAGATLGTITLSASSKYATVTFAFSGVNTTTPISGSVVTGSGTTAATTGTLAACPADGAVVGVESFQGASSTLGRMSGATSGVLTEGNATGASGGSAATNVASEQDYIIGSAVSQTYSTQTNAGASTTTGMAFILAAAAAEFLPHTSPYVSLLPNQSPV